MRSSRRLQNEEVSKIFNCLHDNEKPPPDLAFSIIDVGPDGKKFSPPSYEYKDGLYVLLQAKKNNNKDDGPRVPSNLEEYVMKNTLQEKCKWSLSGPQFTSNKSSLQQRYCYPQSDLPNENNDYASKKGAALWTAYDANGNEDTKYRLLHVYYSEKRAKTKNKKNGRVSNNKKSKVVKESQETPSSSSSLLIASGTPPRRKNDELNSMSDLSPYPFSSCDDLSPLAKNCTLTNLLSGAASSDGSSDREPRNGYHTVKGHHEDFFSKNVNTNGYDRRSNQNGYKKHGHYSKSSSHHPPYYHQSSGHYGRYGYAPPQSCWPPPFVNYQHDSFSPGGHHRNGSHQAEVHIPYGTTAPPLPTQYPLQQTRRKAQPITEISSSHPSNSEDFHAELRSIHLKVAKMVKANKTKQEELKNILIKWAQEVAMNPFCESSHRSNAHDELGLKPALDDRTEMEQLKTNEETDTGTSAVGFESVNV